MAVFVKNHIVPTERLNNKNSKTLSAIDRCTVKMTAQVGNPLSCFYGLRGEIFLTIQHNSKHPEEEEYELVFVTDELNFSSMSDYKFLNTITDIRVSNNRSYINDIYHVFVKNELIYPTY